MFAALVLVAAVSADAKRDDIANSAPLRELFRKRVDALRMRAAPLDPTDARVLYALQKEWALDHLAFWIRHPDPAMARTALEAALDLRAGGHDHPLRVEALFRLLNEPVFGRQKEAAERIASTDFKPDQTTREVLVRLAIDDEALRPELVKALLPHAHLDPRLQRLAASLISTGSEAYWQPWWALSRVPASTCWLVKPTLDTLERTSGDRHVRPISEWVSAHWGEDFLRDARHECDPAWAGEERHGDVCGITMEAERQTEDEARDALEARIDELARERLITFLRDPPPLKQPIECPPAGQNLHPTR